MATRSRRTSPNDPVPDRSEDTSKVRGRSPLAGPIAAVNREVRERHYVSSSEAANRSQLSQLPPPTVKRALVHATSVLTTREGERVLSVDMRPLVIHLLAALEQAGIERAVVTLGHNATQVAECVTEYGFTRLQIDFVYLTLGSAVGAVWCSLANSVIAARALFTGKEPLLIVRADNLYDCRLLRKIADAPFGKNRRLQAYALVDDTPTAVGWATSVRNNWARVALATHDRQCAVRCSPRLGSFDAVVAGEVYATTPQLFEVLTELFRERASTSLADAMSELADRGALGVVQVGELDRHWFESRTLATIFKDETRAQGGLSSAGSSRPWAHIAQAARELLYSGEWRPTANMPTPPLRGDIEKLQMPMLQLGPTLGEGAHGLVVEAEAGPSVGSFSKLAVKMVPINKGGDTEEGGGVMEAVMSEVHALRHLSGHENIVKLIDVVELNAAVYIVLERIGGPGLDEHLLAQPRGVLPEPQARQFFRHLLAALRHAHARGFLHCDVKPANVRLQLGPREGELTAVLVDWGLARRVNQQSASFTEGTILYASPEQLTGYNADQAWGRARLGPPADVWALGVTLYEMLVGTPPFRGMTREEIVANALSLNYDTRPEALSVEARQLVDAMLQVLSSDRASVAELCTEPWTLVDGPMPPETDAVAIELGATDGGRQAQGWVSRVGMYLIYGALVGGALLFHKRSEAGASLPQERF